MVSQDYRIRTDREIKRVMKLGRRFNVPECSVFTMPNTLDHPRMVVIVAAGVSKNAVVRNRIKRQMRDILRVAIQTKEMKFTTDMVIVLRAPAVKIADEQRRAFFKGVLQRARLI